MTVADLLRGLLIESANDAAATLAERVGGSRGRLRAGDEPRARGSSGSTDTHYANPIGLDEPGNYSTARDLVRLDAAAARVRRSSAARSRASR